MLAETKRRSGLQGVSSVYLGCTGKVKTGRSGKQVRKGTEQVVQEKQDTVRWTKHTRQCGRVTVDVR